MAWVLEMYVHSFVGMIPCQPLSLTLTDDWRRKLKSEPRIRDWRLWWSGLWLWLLGAAHEGLCWVKENPLLAGSRVKTLSAETPMIPLHPSHTKLISLRLYFPSPFLPWLDTAQSLLIYSPTAAFALTLATLATLCKAFPCQKRSFLCSPPNPPASLPAALQPLWLPSPKIGNAVTEAMPDVKHISPDRKATSAVKAVGLAQDDPTLMVLNRYFSKITDIELGTWKGQMSMEAEIGQKPLRYPLWLDWSNSRAKWTESCQRSEWLCLQVMAREHTCLM